MKSVMTTPLAIFLHLETIGVILLVLFGRVIATLAISARQSDQRTHENSSYLFSLLLACIGHMNIHERGPQVIAGPALFTADRCYL